MISLNTVSAAEFEARLQENFGLHSNDQAIPLRLNKVVRLPMPFQDGKREPFSLRFVSEVAMRMPQAIYRLENEQMGGMEIFLVQTSPTEAEAVFN